jgi:DNA-binding NarL/FixJ family response regulator
MSWHDDRFRAGPQGETSQDDFVSDRSALERLSRRELQVLKLVVEGKTSREIARLVNISPKTVDTYRSRIMRKLSIDNLPGLVKFAIRNGITSLYD